MSDDDYGEFFKDFPDGWTVYKDPYDDQIVLGYVVDWTDSEGVKERLPICCICFPSELVAREVMTQLIACNAEPAILEETQEENLIIH